MIAFTRHILSNGLTLLHHFDPLTPFAVVNLLYRVGARDEDPDRTGFAHLFEHLMFEGTTANPDFDQPLQEAGGVNNAFTNNDYTNYYIKVPRQNAGLGLYLEADRMQYLDISETKLATQKKVVIEEFKENYTNKPYGDVWHIMRELVYETHPYRWPTIGRDFDHIDGAPIDAVRAFYKRFYHPSNAILCIAGNIMENEALELTRRYLEPVPNGLPANYSHYDEPEQRAAKRKTEYRDIPLDAVYMVFKMPGRAEPEYYAADVLSDIYAGSKSGRLKERLVKRDQLFVTVDCYITGTLDTGMFIFEGKLREGVPAETAERALWREIDAIRESGPETGELEKVRNKLITYMNFSESDVLSRAIGLAYHEMLGDAARINLEETRYREIDEDAVTEFAQRFLAPERSNTLYYLKNESA